jgi:hypothetical protein
MFLQFNAIIIHFHVRFLPCLIKVVIYCQQFSPFWQTNHFDPLILFFTQLFSIFTMVFSSFDIEYHGSQLASVVQSQKKSLHTSQNKRSSVYNIVILFYSLYHAC